LYKNRKETAQQEKQDTKQWKNTEWTKMENKHAKQENRNKNNIIKHESSNWKITKSSR
jgi:hypothetical protein